MQFNKYRALNTIIVRVPSGPDHLQINSLCLWHFDRSACNWLTDEAPSTAHQWSSQKKPQIPPTTAAGKQHLSERQRKQKGKSKRDIFWQNSPIVRGMGYEETHTFANPNWKVALLKSLLQSIMLHPAVFEFILCENSHQGQVNPQPAYLAFR